MTWRFFAEKVDAWYTPSFGYLPETVDMYGFFGLHIGPWQLGIEWSTDVDVPV